MKRPKRTESVEFVGGDRSLLEKRSRMLVQLIEFNAPAWVIVSEVFMIVEAAAIAYGEVFFKNLQARVQEALQIKKNKTK